MSEMAISVECAGDHIGVIGHARCAMDRCEANKTYVCPECGHMATAERVMSAFPEPYRPSADVVVRALQSMADYRLVAVFGRRGPQVEYPRPSLDRV